MNASSGVLKGIAYSFATRFEQAPGTNPEELLAAAHAACYSMAFANNLSRQGYNVDFVETRAVCHLTPQKPAGFKITKMDLMTRGKVAGIDEATFNQIAKDTEKTCPVSQALSAIAIEAHPTLVK